MREVVWTFVVLLNKTRITACKNDGDIGACNAAEVCTMSSPDEESSSSSLKQLPWFVASSQVLGLAAVIVVGVWMGHYRGGFSWDHGVLEFNIHPLCMVIGMVFLYGDAILVYRVFREENKKCIKIIHATLHMCALISSVIGLVAVFDFHNSLNIPNLYSLHSWLGIITIMLFAMQWLLGFIIFLFPGGTSALRAWYLPLHSFFGVTIFGMAVAASLTGITEKLLFSIKDTYSKFPPEGILANALGLLLVAFAACVAYVVTRHEWKRPGNPEEEALSLHFHRITRGDEEED
ncbi:transmembrane ascorbate-dependent reductase CYB561-like isoform X1 [Lethenteron reissneri]|uniref:transmembrane ascorbate-dependent reductase CYB561-like isoform X1 n=2 Tax=Lethenteron reissneri TaxID=7753 RepID=UPI002AB5E357|nr:transmembrane ascorbate-dependent reductase CYB561-like isoform X1 [Lethenteron reissneri]